MDTGIARSKVGGTEGPGITVPGSFCLPTMYRSHYSIYRATIADLRRAISASRPDSFRKTGESGSRKSIGTDPDNIRDDNHDKYASKVHQKGSLEQDGGKAVIMMYQTDRSVRKIS